MRFKLFLTPAKGSVLPINYQYPVSSWIYKCINRADSAFAEFLHQQGYRAIKEGKPFKFFTFSKFDIPKREIFRDRLIIKSDEISLTLSFLVEQAAEKFITGVFQNQHVGIGDKASQVDFEVARIEALPVPVKEELTIKTLSPIVVSEPISNTGKLRAKFLSPTDENYEHYLLQNLIRKYESYATFTGNSISTDYSQNLSWKLASDKVKSSLETIKASTPAQTKVRGYNYTFRLQAPIPLMRIGLLAGFGEKNSLGFGCGEVIQLAHDR